MKKVIAVTEVLMVLSVMYLAFSEVKNDVPALLISVFAIGAVVFQYVLDKEDI